MRPAHAEVRQFTSGEVADSQPRWSPHGRWIAFVSNRQKPKSQVFLIPADGGEARALTALEEGRIGEIAWSPDGSKIAFTFRLTPEDWRESAVKERKEKVLPPPRVSPVRFIGWMASAISMGNTFRCGWWTCTQARRNG